MSSMRAEVGPRPSATLPLEDDSSVMVRGPASAPVPPGGGNAEASGGPSSAKPHSHDLCVMHSGTREEVPERRVLGAGEGVVRIYLHDSVAPLHHPQVDCRGQMVVV